MQSGVPFLARSPSQLEAKSRQHDVLGTVALGTGLIVGSRALGDARAHTAGAVVLISVSFFSRRFAPASETTRGRSRPALQVPIGRRVGLDWRTAGEGYTADWGTARAARPRAILIIGQPCRRRRRPDRRRPVPSTDGSTWTENLRGPGTARNSHGCDSDHSGDGVPQSHLQTCRSTRA
jgi:hypothetical protein